PGQLEGEGEVAGRADVLRVPVVADPWVGRRVPAGDLAGGVGGGVVDDDQLEVGEVLVEDRPDGPLQVRLAVEHRQADADRGRAPGRAGAPTLRFDQLSAV